MDELIRSQSFQTYVTYGTLVVLKMMLLGPFTAINRKRTGFFSSKEDYQHWSSLSGSKLDEQLAKRNPFIERIRRCHRNDLENILPFLFVGFVYVTVANPSLVSCIWHFRIFLGARIMHTICYMAPLPQPSRFCCFLVGWLTTASMACSVLLGQI